MNECLGDKAQTMLFFRGRKKYKNERFIEREGSLIKTCERRRKRLLILKHHKKDFCFRSILKKNACPLLIVSVGTCKGKLIRERYLVKAKRVRANCSTLRCGVQV